MLQYCTNQVIFVEAHKVISIHFAGCPSQTVLNKGARNIFWRRLLGQGDYKEILLNLQRCRWCLVISLVALYITVYYFLCYILWDLHSCHVKLFLNDEVKYWLFCFKGQQFRSGNELWPLTGNESLQWRKMFCTITKNCMTVVVSNFGTNHATVGLQEIRCCCSATNGSWSTVARHSQHFFVATRITAKFRYQTAKWLDWAESGCLFVKVGARSPDFENWFWGDCNIC